MKDKQDRDNNSDSGRYDGKNYDSIEICDRFRYYSEANNVYHLLDYSRGSSFSADRCFDSGIHDRLKIFINEYKDIIKILEYEEARKKKVVLTCYDFIKQLQVHTTPLKVLNKLK